MGCFNTEEQTKNKYHLLIFRYDSHCFFVTLGVNRPLLICFFIHC